MILLAIFKQLKVLERAGLIACGRTAQWRLCRLEPAPLGDVDDWLKRNRRLWDDRIGRLGDHLRQP